MFRDSKSVGRSLGDIIQGWDIRRRVRVKEVKCREGWMVVGSIMRMKMRKKREMMRRSRLRNDPREWS
jgi:hypothetical protein